MDQRRGETVPPRRLAWRLAALLFAGLLAGCTSAPAAAVERLPAGPDRIDLEERATGCVEVFLGVLVDPGHAKRFLPAGFEPADVAEAFGVPVASGRALVSVNAATCRTSVLDGVETAFSELLIPVRPPSVRGADVADADRSGYLVELHTSSRAFLRTAAPSLVPIHAATVHAEAEDAAGLVTGTAVVRDAAGELARFEVAATPGPSGAASVNQFHVTDSGLAVQTISWSEAPTAFGSATRCAIRPGSVVAQVLGTTTCRDVETLGVVMAPYDAHLLFRHVPGASIEEGRG